MTTVIIPYVNGPCDGAELRYALRSIDRNLVSPSGIRVFLLGDCPPWARYLSHIRTPKAVNPSHPKAADGAIKLRYAASLVPGDFVYMYDDTYFINPTTLHDISERNALPHLTISDIDATFTDCSLQWKNALKRTVNMLRAERLPCFNYETHTPRLLNGKLVDGVLDRIGDNGSSILFSTLYFNSLGGQTPRIMNRTVDRYKLGVYLPMPYAQLKEASKTSLVLNHKDSQFKGAVERLLSERFPEKSRYEI